MKRCIITPTFRPHFSFNRDFLASLDAHATDLDEIEVHFVVSTPELDDVRAMLAEFPRVRAHSHAVEDLLRASGYDLDSGQLLRDVGKFAFQCLKKLYALKNLEYDQALIIDSESLLLKPTRVADAFDDYFADPYVFFSSLEHRNENWYGLLGDTVNRNAARLLGLPYPRMHLLEYYGWFYDKAIIGDLFAALPADLVGAVLRLGHDKSIFECVLYYTYLFHNQQRYGYRFESVNDLLKDYLGESSYAAYMSGFSGFWEQVGIFEFVSKEVNERNLEDLRRLFNDRALRFYRSELVNHNEQAQEALIESTPITFLVSSENYRRIKERIAVVISGPPRDYRHDLAYLRNFLTGSNADVFIHAWEPSDSDLLLRTLQPVRHEFEQLSALDARDDLPDVHAASRRERLAPKGSEGAALAGSYSLWRAHQLRRAHEQQTAPYDVVVSIGTGLLPLEDLIDIVDRIRLTQQGYDGVLYVPATAQGVGLDGQMMVGSAPTMDVVSDLWPSLHARVRDGYFQVEHLLLRHVLEHGLQLRTFGANYVPVELLQPATVTSIAPAVEAAAAEWAAGMGRPVASDLSDHYFEAKAESVAAIAALELETPKGFILTTPDGWHVTLAGDGRLAVSDAAPDPAAAAVYLIVAGDSDRTAVDIRPRARVVADAAPGAPVNMAPDAEGILRLGARPRPDTAFFLARRGAGVTLEWRAGFWRTPRSAHAAERVQRAFLVAAAGGLVVGPGAEPTVFGLQRMDDRIDEDLPIGLRLAFSTAIPVEQQAPLTRAAWRLYTAARVMEEGGLERLVRDTRAFARKAAHGREGMGGPVAHLLHEPLARARATLGRRRAHPR